MTDDAATTPEFRRCPRCRAATFVIGGDSLHYGGLRGALSRTTRDDGALVEVCARCGAREALYGYDQASQPPLTEWPRSPEHLAQEEERLIRQMQQLPDEDLTSP